MISSSHYIRLDYDDDDDDNDDTEGSCGVGGDGSNSDGIDITDEWWTLYRHFLNFFVILPLSF